MCSDTPNTILYQPKVRTPSYVCDDDPLTANATMWRTYEKCDAERIYLIEFDKSPITVSQMVHLPTKVHNEWLNGVTGTSL